MIVNSSLLSGARKPGGLRYFGLKASIRRRLIQGLGNRGDIFKATVKFAVWTHLFCVTLQISALSLSDSHL